MPNYQEGKMYKIYNTVNDEIYIGSTTRKLSERMAEHRRPCTVKNTNIYPYTKHSWSFVLKTSLLNL